VPDPSPGGALGGVWGRFRSWPLWLQLAAWLLAWPAVLALLTVRAPSLGGLAKPLAAGVLLFGGLFWWGPLLSANEGDRDRPPTVAEEPIIASSPSGEPLDEPAPEPTVEPAPEPTAEPVVEGPAPAVAGDLQVHFIDVGQGDATLLVAPDATMLIDSGRHDRSDVVPYLQSVGVTALDVVAITHPHADHIGQFDQVLDTFTVAEVWWSGTVHPTRTFERAVAALERSSAVYEEPRAGDTATVGSLTIDVVNPTDPIGSDLHDASLSFRVSYGGVRFLFTGDAETATEQRMIAGHAGWLDADIYQVGHHGSATSTSSPFLDAVSPAVAVYSAGAGNSYGHPHDVVIERLRGAGVEVYGTATDGTVVVTTDGTTWSVSTGAEAPTLAVAPDSSVAPAPAPVPDPPVPAVGVAGCEAGQVDINSAGFEELQQIIHIGPARARLVPDLRPFDTVEQLTLVNGVGPARLADIQQQGLACVGSGG
jgi:competence protein ComEC